MWRFIPFRYYDPYLKTGYNRAALEHVADGGQPVTWLAGWNEPCLNVGRSQVVADEVDLEAVRERGIPIVRRQGGGGTMYLTRDGEITWGIIADADDYPEDFIDVYRQVCGRIVDALDRLGIDAHFEPENDVVTANGKLSGATARRHDGAIYIGGTLLYDVDTTTMFELLTPNQEKLDDKPVERFRDRVSAVSQEADVSFDETVDALREALLDGRSSTESSWTGEEQERAKALAEQYSSDDWIFQES